MSTALLLTRHFLIDHARNPTNLLVLVVTPVVFVIVAPGPLSTGGDFLGGGTGAVSVETVTAGWAAGFVSAIGMYFQVAAARHSDRRLVIAGMSRSRLVLARMLAGATLAALASGAAITALATRGPISHPWRVVAGTAAFALVYVSVGAIVGSLVTRAVNGTMVLLFVWIVDVFFGPAMNGADRLALRPLPTHFVTLWTAGLPATHGGPPPAVWAALWAATSVGAAFLTVTLTSRVGTTGHMHRRAPGSQLRASLSMAWRSWRRTPALWALVIVVPTVFIWLADVLTPTGSTPVRLREDGREVILAIDPAHMHAGAMAPIAIGSLAAVAGVFIALEAQSADQRLVLAGQSRGAVLGARALTVAAAGVVASAASLGLVALLFDAHQWAVYAIGNLAVAATYGLLGMVLGPLVGRVSGAFLAFLIPFLDLAIGQSPMLRAGPADWAQLLPGYGGLRVVLDGALTASFDEARSLALAGAWIAALLALAAVQFRFERASGMLTTEQA